MVRFSYLHVTTRRIRLQERITQYGVYETKLRPSKKQGFVHIIIFFSTGLEFSYISENLSIGSSLTTVNWGVNFISSKVDQYEG